MQDDRARLNETMQKNELIVSAYSQYLNHTPRLLSADMVEDLARECNLDTEEAFLALFSAAIGLEPDLEPLHRTLEREYVRAGVRRLDPAAYENDAYRKAVTFPAQAFGKWEMCEHFYAPFEPFVWNHPVVNDDFREIPQIGYFDREFRFPAILENGVEWMTVTPNEIETMRVPIARAAGRVLTLGLGLGYFAFHASEKDDVERVTVIERDPAVISLFRTHILPQFPHAEKLEIIEGDALEYMGSEAGRKYDYIFADLWHDQSDGLPLYARLRYLERTHKIEPRHGFDYWIEPTLLSALRRIVYEKLTDGAMPKRIREADHRVLLRDEFLRSLSPNVAD
jgi:hypothetical protein